MNANLSISTISGRSVDGDNFTDISKDGSNNCISDGIPPVPKKKHAQSIFLKDIKKVSMNPMPIPVEKGETRDRREVPECGRLTEMEMKKLNTTKHFDNSYLIPVDPPTYNESNLFYTLQDSPFISKHGNSNSFHMIDKPVLRLDSGVGDGESLQGSGSVKYNTSPHMSSPTSEPSSPLSIQSEQPYEDIDHYNRIHEYQHHHLHHQQPQRNGKDSIPLTVQSRPMTNCLQPLPQMNVSGVTVSDSQDCGHIMSTHISDLVSGNLLDSSHAYMQLNISKPLGTSEKPKRKQRSSCWIVIAIIIILLISLAALILSIIGLVSKSGCSSFGSSEKNQTLPELSQAFLIMQQKMDDLVKEKEVLKTWQKNLTSLLEQDRVQMSSQLQNFSYMLEVINVRFDTEVANISLTPGPQGPPGIANFSQCINQSIAMSAPASASAATETSFLPSETDLKNYFVTFAYCTYNGATGAYLETQFDIATTRLRYRCKCWGQVSGVNQTLCTVTIWMCPQ